MFLPYHKVKQFVQDHGNELKQLPNSNLVILDAKGDESGWNEIKQSKGLYCQKSLMSALGY